MRLWRKLRGLNELQSNPSRAPTAVPFVALALLSALAFLPIVRGPIVNVGDGTRDYAPLAKALVSIEFRAVHSPVVFHTVSLALHVSATLLLYHLLKRWR